MHLAELSRVSDVRWNIFFYSAIIKKCVIAAFKLNEIVLLIYIKLRLSGFRERVD